MNKNFWLILTITIWVAFIIVTGLIYYTNRYMPHGETKSTGDYVCLNDDRGPCKEEYKENLRNVDIPNWAKFFKQSGGELLWMGLLFLAIVISEGKSILLKK